MNIERLEKLAAFLENLDESRFDFEGWQSDNFHPNDCKTTACAWGWCPYVFPECDFKVEKGIDGGTSVIYPGDEGRAGFFDIDYRIWNDIFLFGKEKKTAKDVSKQIRSLIEKNNA